MPRGCDVEPVVSAGLLLGALLSHTLSLRDTIRQYGRGTDDRRIHCPGEALEPADTPGALGLEGVVIKGTVELDVMPPL